MPRRSPVLDTVTRMIGHTIGAFSLYLLFSGHNSPGGGFAGGLVAGAGLVLLYAGGGLAGVRAAVAVRPETLLGAGLLIAGATGLLGYVFGDAFLTSGYRRFDVPVLGGVSLTSVLVLDAGVYLVVLGLVLALLTTLGAEPAQDSEAPR